MRPILFVIIIYLFTNTCLGQDYIYKKDHAIIKAKILEIGLENIKYKRTELPDGPTYIIRKNEVYKIRYSNGIEDIIDTIGYVKKTFKIDPDSHCDSVDYSLVYIVYNHGGFTYNVPIYFNNKFILKLRNQNRILYKIYSEGILNIKRFDGKKTGPSLDILLTHGKFYGIKIDIPYPHGLDPNKRFRMQMVTDSVEFHQFLQKDFYSFKPFPKEDFIFEEDRKEPLIK